MHTLILMRHAKAVREHEAPTDKARPLTDRGRRNARAAGLELRDAGLRIDLALVSTAQRTRETFAGVAEAMPELPVIFHDPLYMAGAEQIFAAAAGVDQGAVLVIGHNSGLNDLAALLIARSGDRSSAALSIADHLPTSGIAAFHIDGESLDEAQARVAFLYAPER